MPLLQTEESYKQRYPQSIMARTEGLRAPNYVEIDHTIYQEKVFPPGLFAGTTPSPNKYRFLPRTKFVSLTGSIMTVNRWTANVFVPGDVITVIDLTTGDAGAAVGTVANVDPDTDTIIFTAPPTAPAPGTVIGVATSKPKTLSGDRLGLISPNTIVDFRLRPNSHFGAFLGATVHRRLIPHIDPQLEGLYPQLDFVSP
jgi:hypothetical protein